MQIDVKAKDDEGNILFEGKLNKREVGFLLGYAINDLVAAGVQFNLDKPDEQPDEDPQLRFNFPKIGETIN